MESGSSSTGLVRDESKQSQVRVAGDEWGEIQALIDLYEPLFARILPDGPVNVLEIGAGGGRSTVAVCDVLADRVGDYHVVDVSRRFTKVLRSRIDRPIEVHIVDDVDLSGLPTGHFDLCLAQSSWSHISLYDQYRYLRDLRGVMRVDAPVVVSGLFLLGSGDDWTWNRFQRRVHQIEHDIKGVYHEFTGMTAMAEQLARLEYAIEAISHHGIVARSRQSDPRAGVSELGSPPEFPFFQTLNAFANGDRPRRVRTVVDDA